MRLVVCVDRDDDLGRKAGVRGPVLGREAVLDAVVKLGVADPEDTDTNAMLAAVNVLDELRADREEAEVVVLTGDGRVGVISDRTVARQFDEVLKRVQVDAIHLISDGAEDEWLYPLISSRKHVDSVRRVYVRQSASLQGTYMTLTRALKDQKLRAKTILPLASFLIFLGIVYALQVFDGLNIWSYGLTILLIFVGSYLVFWTFDVDEWIIDSIRSFGQDLRRGSIAVFFGAMSVTLLILGLVFGDSAYASWPVADVGDRVFAFLQSSLIWWIAAGAVGECGHAIRVTMSRGKVPNSFYVASVSIVAFGLESYSLLYFTGAVLRPTLAGVPPALELPALFGILLGVAAGALAGTLRQYLRSRSPVPKPAEAPSLEAMS